MTDTANILVVKGFLDAQYAGDIDRAFSDFAAPGFSWVVGADDNADLRAAIPWAGRRLEGRDGYLELVTLLFGEYEALAFDAKRFTDAGDTVFVEGHFTFRHRETARIADSDFLARFEMDGGRIAGGQFYENTYAVAVGRR